MRLFLRRTLRLINIIEQSNAAAPVAEFFKYRNKNPVSFTRRGYIFRRSNYFTSTSAPASFSLPATSSASALETPSFTAFGAVSTRSFASFKPKPVNFYDLNYVQFAYLLQSIPHQMQFFFYYWSATISATCCCNHSCCCWFIVLRF